MVECVYIFFKTSFLANSWIKSNQLVNSPINSCSAPETTPKKSKFRTFLWRPLWLHNVDLLQPLNTEPHQSHKSIFSPHRTQVFPATASNECPFNLYLIAEWHFPCLLSPSSYPLFYLKIQLAQIGAQHLASHDDVN